MFLHTMFKTMSSLIAKIQASKTLDAFRQFAYAPEVRKEAYFFFFFLFVYNQFENCSPKKKLVSDIPTDRQKIFFEKCVKAINKVVAKSLGHATL